MPADVILGTLRQDLQYDEMFQVLFLIYRALQDMRPLPCRLRPSCLRLLPRPQRKFPVRHPSLRGSESFPGCRVVTFLEIHNGKLVPSGCLTSIILDFLFDCERLILNRTRASAYKPSFKLIEAKLCQLEASPERSPVFFWIYNSLLNFFRAIE